MSGADVLGPWSDGRSGDPVESFPWVIPYSEDLRGYGATLRNSVKAGYTGTYVLELDIDVAAGTNVRVTVTYDFNALLSEMYPPGRVSIRVEVPVVTQARFLNISVSEQNQYSLTEVTFHEPTLESPPLPREWKDAADYTTVTNWPFLSNPSTRGIFCVESLPAGTYSIAVSTAVNVGWSNSGSIIGLQVEGALVASQLLVAAETDVLLEGEFTHSGGAANIKLYPQRVDAATWYQYLTEPVVEINDSTSGPVSQVTIHGAGTLTITEGEYLEHAVTATTDTAEAEPVTLGYSGQPPLDVLEYPGRLTFHGVPASAGTYTIPLVATDSWGAQAEAELVFVVEEAPPYREWQDDRYGTAIAYWPYKAFSKTDVPGQIASVSTDASDIHGNIRIRTNLEIEHTGLVRLSVRLDEKLLYRKEVDNYYMPLDVVVSVPEGSGRLYIQATGGDTGQAYSLLLTQPRIEETGQDPDPNPDPDPSVITIANIGPQTLTEGIPYSRTITATTDTPANKPVSVSAQPLPAGLTATSGDGEVAISGIPTEVGDTEVEIYAEDTSGSNAYRVVLFTVQEYTPPPEPEPEGPLEPAPYRDGVHFSIRTPDEPHDVFSEHYEPPYRNYIVPPRKPEALPYLRDVDFKTMNLGEFIDFFHVQNWDILELFWMRKRVQVSGIQVTVIEPAPVLLRFVTNSGIQFGDLDCRYRGTVMLAVDGGLLGDSTDLLTHSYIVEEPDYIAMQPLVGAETLEYLDIRVQVLVSDTFDWRGRTNRT